MSDHLLDSYYALADRLHAGSNITNQGALMPSITISIGNGTFVIDSDPVGLIDQIKDTKKDSHDFEMGCCQGAEPEPPVDHDFAAAICLAEAAQYLRMACEHVFGGGIEEIAADVERLTAEHLAASAA